MAILGSPCVQDPDYRYAIPSTTRRLLRNARPRRPSDDGDNGSTISHRASVNIFVLDIPNILERNHTHI